ncbi:MAG: hypothetical protein PVJ14_09715 [Chromatiales bacterium]|jgi:hypothetical protein
MKREKNKLRDWESLEPEQRTSIQIEYGYYLDTLPKTCSLDTKIERFRKWLRSEKGICYK